MILGILQARVSSSRLPGKVLKPILGEPMLMKQIERIRRSRKIGKLIIATSFEPADDPIEELGKKCGIETYRGSLNDVLDRFYQAALAFPADYIVRLTGDCPLIDPEVIDQVIETCQANYLDYCSNGNPATFPDGLDVEIFRFVSLEKAWAEAKLGSEREHVTLYINTHGEEFKIGNYAQTTDMSHLRWTVDEPEDFELVNKIYELLYPQNPNFATSEILSLLSKNPELSLLNKHFERNEGLKKSLKEDKIFINTLPGKVGK